jgi:hypothetical protein
VRAAPSEADDRSARTAIAVEQPSPAGHGAGSATERSADLFAADDEIAVHTMNLDPRQGTLAGFELPAEALMSLRERHAIASAEGRQNPVIAGQGTEEPAIRDVAIAVIATADAPHETGIAEEGTTEPASPDETTRHPAAALVFDAPASAMGESAAAQTVPPSSTASAIGVGKPTAAKRRKAATAASTAISAPGSTTGSAPGSRAPQGESSSLPASELAGEPGAHAARNGDADTADAGRRADEPSGGESSTGPARRAGSDEAVLQTMAAL